jgi:hypothetical protein
MEYNKTRVRPFYPLPGGLSSIKLGERSLGWWS